MSELNTASNDERPSADCECACGEKARARPERRLAMLARMSEIGLNIAEALNDELTAPDEEGHPRRSRAEIALTYSRLSRAVGQTLALEVKLEGLHCRDIVETAMLRQAHQARQDEAGFARLRHRGIVYEVMGEVAASAAPAWQWNDIVTAMNARFQVDIEEDPDGAAYNWKPTGAIVAEICKDLNLEPDWSLWAEAHWARSETRNEAPGSPYAHWPRYNPDAASTFDPDDDPLDDLEDDLGEDDIAEHPPVNADSS